MPCFNLASWPRVKLQTQRGLQQADQFHHAVHVRLFVAADMHGSDGAICFSRKDGKQVHDDYNNMKAESKVLNQIIERLQGIEGANGELHSEAERLRYSITSRIAL